MTNEEIKLKCLEFVVSAQLIDPEVAAKRIYQWVMSYSERQEPKSGVPLTKENIEKAMKEGFKPSMKQYDEILKNEKA